ncbi:hypothetical protein K431DRAFT_168405 [Polychaeton citri CBS 116435]|uniref:Uncharacterized protein n=1 Tax=Polychaeton citri CBS 116435 TaxID=1314669 RepID=A0A9P4PXX1_9PEZI|nr:hypothetical protein K431DRAFT_168405 [Polychaeton citri CBS 116435]
MTEPSDRGSTIQTINGETIYPGPSGISAGSTSVAFAPVATESTTGVVFSVGNNAVTAVGITSGVFVVEGSTVSNGEVVTLSGGQAVSVDGSKLHVGYSDDTSFCVGVCHTRSDSGSCDL